MADEIISLDPKKRCEQYLRTNNIVFKKRVRIHYQSIPLTTFDFIIPGAAIIIKNNNIHRLYKKVPLIMELMPNTTILYIYLENLNEYSGYKNAFVEFEGKIKVINSFIEIKIPQIDFYISDLHIIKSLCAEKNREYYDKVQKCKNIQLYCDQTTFDSTRVFMNDIEYNNLVALNINITNTVPNPVCILYYREKLKLRENSLWQLNTMFEIFKIKPSCSSESYETLHRVIPNVTFLCPECDKIFWTRLKVNDKCCKCTHKRKRANNENESLYVFDLFKNVVNCYLDLF